MKIIPLKNHFHTTWFSFYEWSHRSKHSQGIRMKENSYIKCSGCGKDLSDDLYRKSHLPCPDCGSEDRKIFAYDKILIKLKTEFKLKAKDRSGFLVKKIKIREEICENTGRPVKNMIAVDRSNPNETEFHHKIEELDKNGIPFKTIHEHKARSPAKHRFD